MTERLKLEQSVSSLGGGGEKREAGPKQSFNFLILASACAGVHEGARAHYASSLTATLRSLAGTPVAVGRVAGRCRSLCRCVAMSLVADAGRWSLPAIILEDEDDILGTQMVEEFLPLQ